MKTKKIPGMMGGDNNPARMAEAMKTKNIGMMGGGDDPAKMAEAMKHH
jgi:hypothetical protein